MKLNRRLEALEKRLINEPTILTMPEGTTATIYGDGITCCSYWGSSFLTTDASVPDKQSNWI
jgi:hypothetical protein